MLTKAQFNQWWADFAGRYPAPKEYHDRQQLPSALLDTWYQCVAAFDLATLQEVTAGIMRGTIDPVPNTQLGQFGNEIRQRARQVNELRRRAQEPDWKTTGKWSPSEALQEPRMAFMLACAQAVVKLLGVSTPAGYGRYTVPHSVKAGHGSYDAAIIMADEHTAFEEQECLAAFERDGLTWEQIQDTAHRLQSQTVVQTMEDAA